jgi:hypothetical protein
LSCNFLQPLVTSFLSEPNILFSNTLNCVLPLMRVTKFHTHTKQQVKYNYSYVILIFTSLNNRKEDKRFRTAW